MSRRSSKIQYSSEIGIEYNNKNVGMLFLLEFRNNEAIKLLK